MKTTSKTRLPLDLHYLVLGDTVRFRKAPFRISRADRIGVLPGNSEFTLYLLPWKDSPGLWIESPGLGGRYRVPDLDDSIRPALVGQDIVSGQVTTSKFCVVFGSDDGDYSVIPRERAEVLMSDYIFRSYLRSGGPGRRTRKHIPGHRYLAGDQVVIFLGTHHRFYRGDMSLYVRESELSGQGSITEVFENIHSLEINHRAGISGGATTPKTGAMGDSLENDVPGIWLRQSSTKSSLLHVGPGISDDLDTGKVLETWTSDLFGGEGSAKSRWSRFLYKSYLMIGFNPWIHVPQFQSLPAVTKFIADILYWEVLSDWYTTGVLLPEPVGKLMTSGRASEITPEAIKELGSFHRALRVYRGDWTDTNSAVKSMEKIGIDIEGVLKMVSGRLRETDLGDLGFQRTLIEKTKEYPWACRLESVHRTYVWYYREKGEIIPDATEKDVEKKTKIPGVIQEALLEILSGDPMSEEWRLRFSFPIDLRISGRTKKVCRESSVTIHGTDLLKWASSEKEEPLIRELVKFQSVTFGVWFQ